MAVNPPDDPSRIREGFRERGHPPHHHRDVHGEVRRARGHAVRIAARREVHRLSRKRAAAAAVPRHQRGSSSGHGYIQPFDEATYIIDHDIDVDRAIQDRHGPERRNYEERMGITAAARLWVDTFIKGDQSVNPRVFNGIQIRSNQFGRKFHNSAASGGAALSLINLDQMLNNLSKKSGTSYLLVPFISLPLWIQAARTQTLTGFVMQTWDQIGMPKLSYAGHRFLFGYPKDDQQPVLQFNEVASGGGSAVTASLYGLTMGEGMLRGIQVRPLSPEDVGLLQDRKTYRTHIAWDVGIVDEHKYCMTRLDSWTNAAIVA
jgi:hypothetical protein